MKNVITVTFDHYSLFQQRYARIIRRCIETALEAEHITAPCEIDVLITDDEGIQGVNKATRNLDKPTDVLSFPMFEREELDKLVRENETQLLQDVMGDIIISIERVEEQAKEFKKIYACQYIYDEKGRVVWPARAINYTNKTKHTE